MECYFDEFHDVVCEVAGLRFITPFPYGAFELKGIYGDKVYGNADCDNAVVVDVGAFIGDGSLFFASRGAKRVVAFEPIPVSFDILKKNIVLNGFERAVEPRNDAIGDIFGMVKLAYIPTWPGRSSQSPSSPCENASFFSVASIPLSYVITTLGWVDILKLDCEGCEHRALRDAATNGALNHVGLIIAEVHYKVRALIELLEKEGFKITNLTYSSDNWILMAKRPRRLDMT